MAGGRPPRFPDVMSKSFSPVPEAGRTFLPPPSGRWQVNRWMAGAIRVMDLMVITTH